MASLGTGNCVAVLMLLALLGVWGRVDAAEFEVGGKDGWVVPPEKEKTMYNEWASKNRFQVGDTVHFKYKKDSVMVVTQEDYNKCRSTHPIFFSNNGETEVQLDRAGLFYFISGVTGHCERGQRMIIKVIDHGDAPPAGSPPPQAPPSPPHPSSAVPPPTRSFGYLAAAFMLLLDFAHGAVA